MQYWAIIFFIGMLLFLLGVVLLAFKPPENAKIAAVKWFDFGIEINNLPMGVILLGAMVMMAAAYLSSFTPTPSSSGSAQPAPKAQVPSKAPDTLEPADISKPPSQSASREEGDEEESLKSAGWDKTKLRQLASNAKTPKVRDGANRRLSIIATEQKNYEAAKNDIAGLTEFLAKPCEACLVREEGQKHLEKLNAAREQSDEESLKSAGYDKTRLAPLTSGAYPPEIRAEASKRLKIVAQDEESLKSADYDKTRLTPLASGARSPEVRTEAGNRLNMLGEIRSRLYELNFDPDRDLSKAIREFEKANKMAETGAPTAVLLQRLREAGAFKPWGAIVYAPKDRTGGMSWSEDSRQAAVARARAKCGTPDRCPNEISFYGMGCGVFAHSSSSSGWGWGWAISNSVQQAKEKALSDCCKQGRSCHIVAAVCADGTELMSHDDEE